MLLASVAPPKMAVRAMSKADELFILVSVVSCGIVD